MDLKMHQGRREQILKYYFFLAKLIAVLWFECMQLYYP